LAGNDFSRSEFAGFEELGTLIPLVVATPSSRAAVRCGWSRPARPALENS
jgi:hypothetical protein